MSLRLRLTLLYSTFMAGILLVFGAAVFILVNVTLLNQVDSMLAVWCVILHRLLKSARWES